MACLRVRVVVGPSVTVLFLIPESNPDRPHVYVLGCNANHVRCLWPDSFKEVAILRIRLKSESIIGCYFNRSGYTPFLESFLSLLSPCQDEVSLAGFPSN